jgi:hypothetical protein
MQLEAFKQHKKQKLSALCIIKHTIQVKS